MPKTMHRPGFVPPPMGLSYTVIDAQGRIIVPEDFRPTFAPTKPPFEIVFSLTARGLVTVHPADGWPTQSERGLLERTKDLLPNVDAGRLAGDHLEKVHRFFRVLAFRYLDGAIQKGWKLPLPSVVRAWLGIQVRDKPKSAKNPAKRGRPRLVGHPGLIVVGSLGALELWNESQFKEALPAQHEDFTALTASVIQIFEHAANGH